MSEQNLGIVKTRPSSDLSVFSNMEMFENAQRMAKVLVASSLVPKAYQNNVPNAMIALEMANRIGISPFMVMQNLDIIQGNPSWNSTFIIAILNSCGRFDPMRFMFSGEGDDYGCIAYTKDKNGEELMSTKIDWKMVKAEGWLSKPGSKWKTMPDQMFQYRAASFFGRIYASDLLKGMHSSDEVTDMNAGSEPAIPLTEKEIKVIKGNIAITMESEGLNEIYNSDIRIKTNKELTQIIRDKSNEIKEKQ